MPTIADRLARYRKLRLDVLDALPFGVLVKGPALQKQFGISERTLIRRINALRDEGHRIDSQPGYGYMRRKTPLTRNASCGTMQDRQPQETTP